MHTPYDIIDADGHLFESAPGAVDWARYMPEGFKDRAPKVIPPTDTALGLLIDGKPFPPSTTGGRKLRGVPHSQLHTSRPGMWDPHVRVHDMDIEGIRVAVLFSTHLGQRVGEFEDRALAVALAQCYNNWLGDLCRPYPDRLKGAAAVPINDMEETLKEVDRAVSMFGMPTVGLLPHINYRNLDDPYYEPLYRELERLDISLSSHYQGVANHMGKDRKFAFFYSHILQHPLEQMMAFAYVTSGGVLDRHPKLRVAFLEGNVGWLPWWVDRVDEHYEKLSDQVAAKAKPSDYLKGDNLFFGCEVEEATLPYVCEKVGAERLLYASDYWHWDATFPGSVKALQERTDLPEDAKRLILGENAKRLYKLNGKGTKK